VSEYRRHALRALCNESGQLKKAKQTDYISCQELLEKELKFLQNRTCAGHELEVRWLPGHVDHQGARKISEEVRDDIIFIYAEDPKEAGQLLRHGFFEWLMNRHTKPYRQLINKLISLFEDLQYENKEKTIKTLERLL
jgi:hypothetical protein